ncbi:MAG: hypothetical protein QW039_01015 [Fervidicoccaceae archaeon]
MSRREEKIPSLILGFGNVGRELILRDELWNLTDVRGVVVSKGGIRIRGKDDAKLLIDAVRTARKLNELPNFSTDISYQSFIDELYPRGVAFIAIPPSYKTGEPNISIVLDLLKQGISVITADKTPLALAYSEIMETSIKKGAYIGFRATVAAGIPLTDLARGVFGRDIETMLAILNASTNFILTQVEEGLSWSEAISKAEAEKLLEPDPKIDIEGWDPAAKLVILSNILGQNIKFEDVERIPLFSISESDVRKALLRKMRYKYIASLSFKEKEAKIQPVLLSQENPLSRVSGNYNAMMLKLEEKEYIYAEGPAGPAWRTARVMITDLFELLRYSSSH